MTLVDFKSLLHEMVHYKIFFSLWQLELYLVGLYFPGNLACKRCDWFFLLEENLRDTQAVTKSNCHQIG